MTSRAPVRRIAMALGAGAAVCALSLGGAGLADAKIQPVDTQCTNNGGHQPGGQQPSCGGNGLTQETENQNPSGHAPPGQN
ncbi:hypothetical protein TUSST3_32290 [Streptomyces sp. TUS-ST3]|uniref:hypothetical protein n=1 Tax=unclassified Streptomyces TaxID=2593676 RepID=UPI001BAEECE2|nr:MULTISPECIES: hypothetical protein [unclassified Streptomyces]QUC61502.1 hypothetical protein IOD14_34555 [Streptomyces sp. A2-16]GLP66608.1 hypothetical protein TUSST3_32290 [Streptomyces sp. TUS-ST3]